MNHLPARSALRRAVLVGAMAGALTLGAAAATAVGLAPWSPPAPAEESAATVTQDSTTDSSDPAPTTPPDTSGTTDTSAGDHADPPGTDPSVPDGTTPDPADTTPADTTPADTTPADTTPADTTPADTDPADTDPPTTSDEGKVPLGITLHCTVEATSVHCHWSGGVVSGFARFLLLRGDGGPKGRVPFTSTDPAADDHIDTGLAPGSYSYVVITVDDDARPLVHSNPVYVQIAAPA